MSGARGVRPGRLLVLALVVMVAAGCQLEVQVGIDVDDEGTGEVRVAAALDEAAASRVPDLADQLDVDDLVDAAWTVTGPSLQADGRTWITASKTFSSPEEAGAVLDEISGEDGPFRDFGVRRSSSLLRHRWEFTGNVDLAAGLAGFSDDALRERLDGTDVGQSEDELTAAAGRALSDMFTFRVAVALPGDVTSNAPGSLDGGAVWRPTLGEQLTLTATGTKLNVATLVWLAVAVAFGLALVVLLVVRVRRRRAGATVPAPVPVPVPVPAPASVPEGAAAPEPAAAPAPLGAPVRAEDRPAGPAPAPPADPADTMAGPATGPTDAAEGGAPAEDPSADGAAGPVEDASVEPDAVGPDAAEPDAAELDAAAPAGGASDDVDDADDALPGASEVTRAAPADGETGQAGEEPPRTVTE